MSLPQPRQKAGNRDDLSKVGLTFDCQSDGATLSKFPPTFPIILGLRAAEPNFDWRSQTGHNIGRRSQMPPPETGLAVVVVVVGPAAAADERMESCSLMAASPRLPAKKGKFEDDRSTS